MVRGELRVERAELARLDPGILTHASLVAEARRAVARLGASDESRGSMQRDLHLELHGFGLARIDPTGGREVVGASLPLAPALLRDPGGNIVLHVPFSHEAGLTRMDLVRVQPVVPRSRRYRLVFLHRFQSHLRSEGCAVLRSALLRPLLAPIDEKAPPDPPVRRAELTSDPGPP